MMRRVLRRRNYLVDHVIVNVTEGVIFRDRKSLHVITHENKADENTHAVQIEK